VATAIAEHDWADWTNLTATGAAETRLKLLGTGRADLDLTTTDPCANHQAGS
jgi:hypothetical protein